MSHLTLTLDGKNRISLTKLLKGIKSKTFDAHINKKGNIELTPMALIPESEAWLFENKNALESVKRGLQQTREGKVKEIKL